MNIIENKTMDEERALYGSRDLTVRNCRFDGPADGESALKESRGIVTENCYFNLRYALWHDVGLKMTGCELTPNCRAAIWYTRDADIENCKLHGIKALRECDDIRLRNCDIYSWEFGWFARGIQMQDCTSESEYFMLHAERLDIRNATLRGKYTFQYIQDAVLENCDIDTKDCLWHAKNVVVRNSVIRSEYLAWYCENVTFENCTITSSQPLCYCKNLRLVNCIMREADLSFERSEVEATLTEPIESIKNPTSGTIRVPAVGALIMDDPNAKAEILIGA